MKEIRPFLDDIVIHAKTTRRKATTEAIRNQGESSGSGEYLSYCPESLGNAIRGCRRLAFFLEAKSSAQDDPLGGRSPPAITRDFGRTHGTCSITEDHFDGFSATKSSDFLIDLEGTSMDHAPDVRPYLMFLGVWFAKRYLPPAVRDKSEEVQADYYVQKGKALLLSCWKRGKGYFLEPRDDLLEIHRGIWRHGTMPWLYHVEKLHGGSTDARKPRDGGFDAMLESNGATGHISMGEISVILTNLRMPLLPRRCLTIRPDSHPEAWDEMVLRNYDPRHHPAAHWRMTTYITSMEVLHRSSKLFSSWTSPYHARIMVKVEAYIGDIKLLRDHVNGMHEDFDIAGLGLRELKDLPVEPLRQPRSSPTSTRSPTVMIPIDATTKAVSIVTNHSGQYASISAIARRSDLPHLTILDLPVIPLAERDMNKFRFFRKDHKSAVDVNKYPGYPFPGYVHYDGLTPRRSADFFIDLHGDSTDWEPDVRPYLLAVGRYALEKELGGVIGKRTTTDAEKLDAIVQLGKDYLLWRWRKGEGFFLRPRDGLLELNELECIRTMPWCCIAQQLAGQPRSRRSSQLSQWADVGFSSPPSSIGPKDTHAIPSIAPSGVSAQQLTNVRAPLLPRMCLTIDPYVNEPSWDEMVLTHYDIHHHPVAYWHRHRFGSVSEYRIATAARLAAWTIDEYDEEMKKLELQVGQRKRMDSMKAIEEEYELL